MSGCSRASCVIHPHKLCSVVVQRISLGQLEYTQCCLHGMCSESVNAKKASRQLKTVSACRLNQEGVAQCSSINDGGSIVAWPAAFVLLFCWGQRSLGAVWG